MNVRGERIIVFGDSLSKHGSDNAPEIWDVNQGSNRASSAPGDLVASLLAEQGAQAVRVNARVSRSAWNFWSREATNSLLASDRAFAPTKVVIILGTNDVGLNTKLDSESFAKLRDAYKAMGAEVWAVGPFANTALPAAGVEQVVATMRDQFGSRFIDGRPISALIHPGGDGVHYQQASARTLALAITDAVISKFSPSSIFMTLGLGAAGVVGAVLLGMVWKRRKQGLLGDGLGKRLDRDSIDRMIEEGDEADLEVVQDALIERGDKLTQITRTHGKVGTHTYGYFELPLGNGNRLVWRATNSAMGKCEAQFTATGDSKHDMNKFAKHDDDAATVKTTMIYAGVGDWCERAAAADAWAMAKAIKRLEGSGAHSRGRWTKAWAPDLKAAMEHASNTDNSEPEELYGLGAHAGESGADVKFHELIREDDPAAMEIAEDLILERGWKLHHVTGGRGARNFTIDFGKEHWYGTVKDGERVDNPNGRMVQASVHERGPIVVSQHKKQTAAERALKRAPADAFIIHEPETSVTNERWLVARPRANVIEMTVKFGGTRVKREYESFAKGDDLRRQAVADAWTIAKTLKPLPVRTPWWDVELIVEDITKRDNVKERSELYGVNIVDGKRSTKDHNALVRSGARQIACKSGLDRQATCWTLAGVNIALGDAKQMLSAFETQLVGTPAGKALLKTLTPEQVADVRKVVTQAARNAEQLEAFEREEAGELEGLGAYRVWYGSSDARGTFAVDDGRSIATVEQATKLMRAYKRQGRWAWVEDEQGNFVPVPGAKSEKGFRKGYPKRDGGLGSVDVITYVVQDATQRAKPWASSRKVFISDAFEQVRADGRDDGMSLDEFKRELVKLHRAGKVRLARADLVAAMPGKKVAASETDANGATFHFIERT